ncbi:2'-5'-oligoadenylate synthase 1 isoform X2 [Colius striatus]|uniref:2'-5'-oligoadenylate synthase 1 isoform X2 n=1 Tax=Colius striatus TaxID=57412 RepID=UPI00052991E2|nr:2'-5'-oligoadenylate synthase 1 isoform X2 [Colius striatus]
MDAWGLLPAKNKLTEVTDKNLDDWIMRNLQPSSDFCRQVKQTVKQICEFLKRDCFGKNIHVHKTVKGGSAGKGTALQNNSDADVVLFLSCFSSYQQQNQDRDHILDLIKQRLHACKESLSFTVNITEPRYKGPKNTSRSLSLTLFSRESKESIDVDILPAYDALGQVKEDAPPDDEVYVKLLDVSTSPGEFSPCFTELQKKFVKRHPAKLKNLLRLVKYWYKESLKPMYPNASLPPKYALELLTIYAWEEGTGSSHQFDTAAGFRTVLELLRQHQEICVYWETYYSLQHSRIGAHVRMLLGNTCPVILDPADPTGILGQGKEWNLVAQEATKHLSLPCVRTVEAWNVQPARSVTIEVKQLVGTSLSMTVSPSTTVRKLKEKIQKEWEIPWYNQRLALQKTDTVLQDSETLATHGIFYNTTLVLLQTEPKVMEIFVKDEKNRTTTYTVKPTHTVRQLKEQVQKELRIPADQQRLTYCSKELEDCHMLAHYNIQPLSTIFLLLRLRGGTSP